ncbi:IS200/IS605 family transposase [Streptomyces chartreusis]|uniref:IS200/IS605 family transposase n=1 Tax=Streptomyces chartreusis TaxID=1969 RepID=UPI00367FFA79
MSITIQVGLWASTERRTGRHCAFSLHAHLIFVTKFRHQVSTDRHLKRCEESMRAVRDDFEMELSEFNGEAQHAHIPVNFPPNVEPSKLVNSLKGVSSRRLRQECPDLVQHYWRENKLWSGSHFAGSVSGAPLSIVKQYIKNQNRPDPCRGRGQQSRSVPMTEVRAG